jgi:hypothetical protein
LKELEKRIDDIEKGELELLRIEYDYAAKLTEQVPELNNVSKIIYDTKMRQLLGRVENLIPRSQLIINKTLRICNEDWDDDVSSDEQGVEFKSPGQFFV